MQFKDFPYEHLAFEDVAKEYEGHLAKLINAHEPQSFKKAFDELNVYRGHVQTMMTLSSIRHTVDTSDPYYDRENTYWDNTAPQLQVYENRFFDIMLECPFKEELNIPEVYFKLIANAKKAFNESIIAEAQEENRLSSEYGKLKASAKIEMDGETYNLATLAAKLSDNDRSIRAKAMQALEHFYAENEDRFDEIFDQLIKVRDQMAKKLGFENFIPLAYLRMNRIDYNQKDVETYREGIVEYLVPIATELFERQAKRIGVDKLLAHDIKYSFKTGNPKPIGNKDYLVDQAEKMYHAMSKESGEYFSKMKEMELFDLESKPHKEMGGYCTDLYDYKVPFIFSNFNGTQGDIDVLTHEAGHGFQSYLTMQNINIPDICFPTYESCEIHSMSMEFFAHPYMESFFGKDSDKYRFAHLEDALTFIPYGCLVDHFQHAIYAHPEMTKEERKATFRRLEKLYKPHADYTGYPLFEKGAYFYQQNHIFQSPFYYIDYTLAQVCALQFYQRMLDKDPNVWSDYVKLCRLGGSDSFLGLVKAAGLKSPFDPETIKSVVARMHEELNAVDDSSL